MNTRVLWGSPGCGVDSSPTVSRTREGLPIDEKRDGVFGLGNTIVRLSRGDAGCSAGHDTSRDRLSLEEPTTDIDVVR
jgi:hypothetical protein